MPFKLSIAMFSTHSCPLEQLGTRDTGDMKARGVHQGGRGSGGHRDGQNGYLVSSNRPESLAGGVAAVLHSEEMNQTRIKQSAFEYDGAFITREIEREYQAILASKNLAQKATT